PISGWSAMSVVRSVPTQRSSDLDERHDRPDAQRLADHGVEVLVSTGGELVAQAREHVGMREQLVEGPRQRRRRGLVTGEQQRDEDRKSTRLNSSHVKISYAVVCL